MMMMMMMMMMMIMIIIMMITMIIIMTINWKGGDLLGFLPSCSLLGLVSVQSRGLRTPEVDFHNCEAFYEAFESIPVSSI